MSQVKVEQNKELKKNRKKIVKKNRRRSAATTAVFAVALCVIVGWVAYSVYGKYEVKQIEKRRTVVTEITLDPITDYLATLTPTEEE